LAGERRKSRGKPEPRERQGMDAIATEEWAWMVRRGMAQRTIRISAAPGEDGSAVDKEAHAPR
jgi:hypothetical protein